MRTERRVGSKNDSLLVAVLLQFEGGKAWVELDLIRGRYDRGLREENVEVLDREVRNSDRADLACCE